MNAQQKNDHPQVQGFHDASHHGAFGFLALTILALCITSSFGEPPANPEPLQKEGATEPQLATPEQLTNGLRRGLFAEVAEEGKRLLANKPDTGVKGAVAVCLAATGEMVGVPALLQQAGAANEPSHGLHQALTEVLVARSKNDAKSEIEACNKAISLDVKHPVAYLFLAESAFQRKDYAAALEQTEKALALEPQMAPAFLVRGLVFRARKEVPAAMKAFSNAVTLDPRDLRSRLAIAETAEAVANYGLAARVYRDVISLNPTIAFIVRERFLQSLVETDQMEEATKVAAPLLAERPASATVHLCAGRAAAWLDRRPEAIQHFTQCEKIAEKNNGLAPYFIGLCELANGRITEARLAFERSAASITLKSSALTAIGVALHHEGKHAEAAKSFKEALANAPVGLVLRINFHLGLLSLDEKNWNAAKKYFTDSGSFVVNLEINSIDLESLYRRSPKNALASTSLGALFTSEKMPAAAVQAFRKSQETNDKDVLALLLGSNLSALQLNYDEALKQLAAVGGILENYWPAYYAAGSIEYSRRDYEKALPYLATAAKHAPENVSVQTRLIALYLLNHKNEEAEAACIEMINRIPNSPVGYNELAGLLTARGDAESLANALEVATKAVELNPKSGLYLDTLGWVRFKQGKFDVALEELTKAEELEPGNAEIQYHLGAALDKAGKVSESIIHLNLAIVAGPGSDIAKEASSLLKQVSQKQKKQD